MARPLRIQGAGLTYHVTSRGNARMVIFRDDDENARFLKFLAEVATKFRVECHAYCLMVNHYHLVLRTQEPNLSRAMHRLNSRYAQWWNRRHRQIGHPLQGRFRADVLDESHYLNACRYAVQNPVRARMTKAACDWPWSSYHATVGFVVPPDWLWTDGLLRHFGDDRASALAAYRRFVDREVQSDHPVGRDIPILGDEVFRRRFKKPADAASREVTRWDRLAAKPSLEELFAGVVTRADRNARICDADRLGYTMAEIGRYLELHYATISRIISKQSA